MKKKNLRYCLLFKTFTVNTKKAKKIPGSSEI